MIGRSDDLTRRGALRGDEQTLLPNLPWYKGDERAGLAQNMGQLRDYVRSAGHPPIRDASPGFKLDRSWRPKTPGERRAGEFLEAERNQLENLGYRREGEYWVHRQRGP